MFDVKLSHSTLHVDEIYRSVVSPKCGAVSLFVGTTRDNFEGLMVTKLIYESYENMAIKMMETVCEEIVEKWTEIEHVAIHHRLGEVPVSEASVVIALSSPHRKDSLEALHFAIDRLKEIVPIFKKEYYQDGGAEWKQNAECSCFVEGFLSTALANASAHCANNEFLRFNIPDGSTCLEYMQDYINMAGGSLQDENATVQCEFCPLTETNTFLMGVNIDFANRWRNWGILWAFIIFNIASAVLMFWLLRVPKTKKAKKE